jgi:hypothetical protein
MKSASRQKAPDRETPRIFRIDTSGPHQPAVIATRLNDLMA